MLIPGVYASTGILSWRYENWSLGGYRWHLEVGHVDWYLPRIRRAVNLVPVYCSVFPLKDMLKMGLSLAVMFKWWGCDLFAEFKVVLYIYPKHT